MYVHTHTTVSWTQPLLIRERPSADPPSVGVLFCKGERGGGGSINRQSQWVRYEYGGEYAIRPRAGIERSLGSPILLPKHPPPAWSCLMQAALQVEISGPSPGRLATTPALLLPTHSSPAPFASDAWNRCQLHMDPFARLSAKAPHRSFSRPSILKSVPLLLRVSPSYNQLEYISNNSSAPAPVIGPLLVSQGPIPLELIVSLALVARLT